MQCRVLYPFTAIVGLDKLKLAMLINAVNPAIGGLLIRGPKGSGKTTAVRALRDVLPKIRVAKGCPFNCNPSDPSNMCEKCSASFLKDGELSAEDREMRVVDLPLGATEDRVVGSLDIEKAIKQGVEALEPGILAEANQNILYVDEINLLPDHIADDLLDSAATGWNVVEREGISVSHPSRFIFIGTMNPEEGQLRPQLLDRFSISMTVEKITSVEERMEVVKRNLRFEADPEAFLKDSEPIQKKLRDRISQARKKLASVKMPPKLLETICRTCLDLDVDGLRPDIVISKAAMTLTAFEDRREVGLGDVLVASELALSHRTREGGFKDPATPEEIKETLLSAAKTVGYVPQKPGEKPKESGEKGSGGSKDAEKEGRAVVMARGEMNEKFRDFLRKRKALFERWKALSGLIVWLNRSLRQVIFAFGRRLKMKVKGMPKVKAAVKSDKPLRADEGEEGKEVYLKKMKGIPSVETATRSPKIKKGFFLFRVFQGSTKISGLIPNLSFRVKNVGSRRIGSFGKRAEAVTAASRGRATGWRLPKTKPRDIHLPATIRAAARKRAYRKSGLETAFSIDIQDIREKLRRYKAPLIIVFVLDLSGSMMLNIQAVKQAILKLHGDAYRFRDRVGIVALKDTGAIVVQHPITNLRVVANRLMALKISGYTPIASGMLKAWEVLRESKRRDPSAVPVMVLITDGSANVPLKRSLESGEVREIEEPRVIVREYEDLAIHDALSVSKMVRREGIHTIVINTNPRLYGRETFGFAVTEQIAAETRGTLHVVGRLASEEQVVERIMEKVAEDQRLIAAEAS